MGANGVKVFKILAFGTIRKQRNLTFSPIRNNKNI